MNLLAGMRDEDDDEMMRMEIMLGMTKEEGIPCLLCLMPRCLCHITLDLTKLELQLRRLEEGGKEQSQEQPEYDGGGEVKAAEKGVLEEGNPGGPLEGEGLTSSEEGSFTPQGPTGGPESVHTLDPEGEEEGTPPSTLELDRKEDEEVEQEPAAEPVQDVVEVSGDDHDDDEGGKVDHELEVGLEKVDEEAADAGDDEEQVQVEGDGEEQVQDEGDKVNPNNELLAQMRRRMKLAEKENERQEDIRNKKKAAAQRKKEEDRKKEDRKHAESSKSVREMLRRWNKEEESKDPPGNILLNAGLARRKSGREQGRKRTGADSQEDEAVRKSEEDEAVRKSLAEGRKTPTESGKMLRIIDRKSRGEDEEDRKEDSSRKVTRPGETSRDLGRKRKLGTSDWDGQRPNITDLIRSYNCLDTVAKNSGGKARSQVVEKEKLVGNQSRKGEKLLVGKPVDGKKRKLEMEEIDLLKSSGQKRRRKPLILPEPESERDKHIDKNLIPNILLTSL